MITHLNNFEYHFPDVDLLPPSTSNSGSSTLYSVFFMSFLSCIVIKSNQLISIASSFIVLYQNNDIQFNKILLCTSNDNKIVIAETSDIF